MSVPKSKRTPSNYEFEIIYRKVVKDIDVLINNNFYRKTTQYDIFLHNRSKNLDRLANDLIYYIKISNSIYPTCQSEYEERRINIDKAIGVCFTIITEYERITNSLELPDDKYVSYIQNISHLINSLKNWRKSDNRFKQIFNQV